MEEGTGDRSAVRNISLCGDRAQRPEMSSGLAYGELRAISQRARYTDSFRNPRGIVRLQSFSSSIFERCGEKRFGSWNGASRDVACTARGRINKARTSTSSRTIGKERAATLARIAVQFLSLLFAVE